MMKNHTNSAYDNELRLLKDRILLIAGRVERMLANAIKSLVENNAILARKTIDEAKEIDRDELLIDRFCLELLARRQPLGQDLRFIVAVTKMTAYFDRLGDLTAKICQRIIDLKGAKEFMAIESLVTMAKGVQGMIKETLEAFLARDCAIALSVMKKDIAIDEIFHLTTKNLIAAMNTQEEAENYYHLLSIAKWLERMGDHCVNLAELIVFMIKGEDIRHNNASLRNTTKLMSENS